MKLHNDQTGSASHHLVLGIEFGSTRIKAGAERLLQRARRLTRQGHDQRPAGAAVEAVDRCMRGEGAPSPIYEGEDSLIAWVLSVVAMTR